MNDKPLGQFSRIGPICPYCKHQHRPDDPFYFDEATLELECMDCGAMFNVRVHIETNWRTTPK